jgi:hypothetical protein
MAQLVTDDAQFRANNRVAGIRLGALFLRQRGAWAGLFGGDDAAAIMIAIAVIRSERILRDRSNTGTRTFSHPVADEELGPINISSIATATGMNRETARRKVRELVQAGKLVADEGGLSFAPGLTQEPAFAHAILDMVETLRSAANDLLRLGILHAVP